MCTHICAHTQWLWRWTWSRGVSLLMKYSPRTHKTEFYLSAELHKMGMWYAPVIPVLRGGDRGTKVQNHPQLCR